MGVEGDGGGGGLADSATDEREHEASMTLQLRGDLEFEQRGAEAEDDHVAADDHGLEGDGEELRDAPEHHEDGDAEVREAEDVAEVVHDGLMVRAGAVVRW